MRRYESIVVFDPALGEADVKAEIKKLQGVLGGNNAQEVSVDNWGKREISYFVGKNKYGFYVQFSFAADGNAVLDALSHQYRINERVIKFQTHRLNDRSRKFKGNPKKKPNTLQSDVADELLGDSEY